MSTEIARPTTNPWLDYGNAATARAIVGLLLKFSKGDYLAGTEDEPVPTGTRLIANMDSLLIGWVRWEDNVPVEQQMGLVMDNYQPANRKDLSHTDKALWDRDDKGKERDPWQFTNYLVLFDKQNPETVYTFATSSGGGRDAIGELSKAYGKAMRQRPDQYPVIELGVGQYRHRDRTIGWVKYPTFRIVDWVDKGPYSDPSGTAGAPAIASGAAPAVEEEEEIPF
jgi:hypothetical protein